MVVAREKTRRLNVVINESLIEWASSTAENRGMTVSAFVRHALEVECRRSQDEAIAQAVDVLAPLYAEGTELTAFSALDADDFA
ncbi:MAG: hypothetical protein A2V67_10045 [Deltaproteobacteria bacterium RBG_13_61_14]|nr:MAG: hypothetical protein A2V67_10045 [Deltaproteobacteria bacterium RBG_13_61_14]